MSANTERPSPAFNAGVHIPALDGLRGIAVLIVMVMHFSLVEPLGGVHAVYTRVSGLGWTGVDLFFVLSGFLITGILYDAKGAKHYFRNFYARRTLRIFPLYYAFLVALFVILPLLAPSTAEPEMGEERLWMWAYLGNVLMARAGWEGLPAHTTHLWSLAVEEQFYLIWPLIVWWASRKRLIAICIGAIALASISRVALHLLGADPTAGYTLLPARVDTLAVGSVIAILARDPAGLAWLRRSAKPSLIGALAVIVAVMSSLPVFGTLPPRNLQVQFFAYPAVAIVAAACLVMAMQADSTTRIGRAMSVGALPALGRYSYALYLFHVPIRDVIRNSGIGSGQAGIVAGSRFPLQVAIIAAGIGVTYVVALVSWNLFEKHFLELKRYFPYESPARRQDRSHPAVAAEVAILPTSVGIPAAPIPREP